MWEVRDDIRIMKGEAAMDETRFPGRGGSERHLREQMKTVLSITKDHPRWCLRGTTSRRSWPVMLRGSARRLAMLRGLRPIRNRTSTFSSVVEPNMARKYLIRPQIQA